MEQMTARQFALLTGRSPRTVQQWVEGHDIPEVQLVQHPGAPRAVYQATRATWERLAAIERKRGPKPSPKYKTPPSP